MSSSLFPQIETSSYQNDDNLKYTDFSQLAINDSPKNKNSSRFRILIIVAVLLIGMIAPIYLGLHNSSKAGSNVSSYIDAPTNITILYADKNTTELEWSPSASPIVNKYIVQKNGIDMGTTTKSSFIAHTSTKTSDVWDIVAESDYTELGAQNVLLSPQSDKIKGVKLDSSGIYKYVNNAFGDYLKDKNNRVTLNPSSTGYSIFDSNNDITSMTAHFNIPNSDVQSCSKNKQNIGMFIGLKSYLGTSQASSDGVGLQVMCSKNSKNKYTMEYSLYLENVPVGYSPIPILYGGLNKVKLAPGSRVGFTEQVLGSSIKYSFDINDPKTNKNTNFNITLPSCSNYECYYNSATAEILSDGLAENINFNKITFEDLAYTVKNSNKPIPLLSKVDEGKSPSGHTDNIYYKWDESNNSVCSVKAFAAPSGDSSINKLMNDNFGTNADKTGRLQDVNAISGVDNNIQNGALELIGKPTYQQMKNSRTQTPTPSSIILEENLLNQKNIGSGSSLQFYYNKPTTKPIVSNSNSKDFCYVEPPSLWEQVSPVLQFGFAVAASFFPPPIDPIPLASWAVQFGAQKAVGMLGTPTSHIDYNYNTSFVAGVATDSIVVGAKIVNGGLSAQDYRDKLKKAYEAEKAVRESITAAKLGGGVMDAIDLERGIGFAEAGFQFADIAIKFL